MALGKSKFFFRGERCRFLTFFATHFPYQTVVSLSYTQPNDFIIKALKTVKVKPAVAAIFLPRLSFLAWFTLLFAVLFTTSSLSYANTDFATFPEVGSRTSIQTNSIAKMNSALISNDLPTKTKWSTGETLGKAPQFIFTLGVAIHKLIPIFNGLLNELNKNITFIYST
jgi:hypothetical protein